MTMNKRAKLVLRTMGRNKYNRCMKVLQKMLDEREHVERNLSYANNYLKEQKTALVEIQKKIAAYEIEMARTLIHEDGKVYNQ